MNHTRSSSSQTFSDREQRERSRQLQIEQAQLEQRFQQYASTYEIQLAFPAVVTKSHNRTNDELLQHRLLEAGISFDEPAPISSVFRASSKFAADLQSTGCIKAVKVTIGDIQHKHNGDSSSDNVETKSASNQQQLHIHLDEDNLYRLYVGGGLKSDSMLHSSSLSASESASGGMLGMAEAQVSVGLRNALGYLDTTSLQYIVDVKNAASWTLHHQQPLYTLLPHPFKQALLTEPHGSQCTFHARAMIDTLDFEWTRSYKEFQRLVSLKATNTAAATQQHQATSEPYASLEWTSVLRDIVPRRHTTLPYALDASPSIVSQSGPTVKHSFIAQVRTNGMFLNQDDYDNNDSANMLDPISGVQANAELELATPPGDVGFVKCQGGASLHVPLNVTSSQSSGSSNSMRPSLHLSLQAGYLHAISFGGLCRPPTVSDRFFVGGPMQLRGFSPAGIGPRAYPTARAAPKSLNSSAGYSDPAISEPASTRGDALGGDFYYTASAMASLFPTPLSPLLSSTLASAIQVVAFVNAGTCVGTLASTPASAVLQSTRVSVGLGLSSVALGQRVELTYAVPLRFGPRDVRRHVQFGMGFSIG